MEDFIENIADKAKANTYFRQVLDTGVHTQVVIMSIVEGGEIGEETHTDNDQVLYLVEGEGKVVLNDVENVYKAGDLVLVKAGTKHNFINTGKGALKIITSYSPPHHPPGTVHKTKEEADNAGY